MSGKAAQRASPRARTSEGKLFQICLSACIDGIEKLPVDKRGNRAATNANKNTHGDLDPTSSQHCAATPPQTPKAVDTLPSPPPSPPASPSRTSTITATMDRSQWHNAQPQGSPHAKLSSQDARSNLAVQPAANAGSFKLKKNAVKMVGAASPVTNAQPKATPSVSQTAPSPIAGPVKAQPKGADGPVATKATTPATPTSAPKPVLPKIDIPKQTSAAETALDDLFSRLMAKSPATKAPTTPSRTSDGVSLLGPDKSKFTFDPPSKATDAPMKAPERNSTKLPTSSARLAHAESAATIALPEKKLEQAEKVVPQEIVKDIKRDTNISKEHLENEYLRKANEYFKVLPARPGTLAHTLQVVSTNLRATYAPDTKLTAESAELLKARYGFAVATYATKVLKKGSKPLTADLVKQALKESDGNFLSLCATLADEEYISLENTNDVSGLGDAILNILPKADPTVQAPIKTTTSATATPVVQQPKLGYKDPVDSMTAWPSQDKRENAPTCRTCILKGVSGVTSINQLQALVWGGRLESITMQESGSDTAHVKFLTPEGFQKYFEATQNGIELSGDKKTFVFVEKAEGPNSVNDVIRNCIEGDATRCVRAVGAEEDWSDVLLLRLARGKGLTKREVDRIKRGKTARGHHYIEFRFANILHALAFKRLLMDDDDWEHCTISYAPDPCETARGVHYKDEDETSSGFLV